MTLSLLYLKGGSMEKVRLGLIGMGMIGKLHAETMSRMKDVDFVAASDIDAKHQEDSRGARNKILPVL